MLRDSIIPSCNLIDKNHNDLPYLLFRFNFENPDSSKPKLSNINNNIDPLWSIITLDINKVFVKKIKSRKYHL